MQFLKEWWGKFSAWNQRKPAQPAAPRVRQVEPAGGSYATDQPVNSSAADRFGRARFAHRIADTIATRADPASLVIGLYGPWGDGKTSVLFMIEERLRTHQKVIVVRFNPWHFSSDEQLVRGFFATLSAAVGSSLTTRAEDFGDALKKYGALSSAFAGDSITGLGEALSTTSLDQLKARVEGALDEAGQHVVVLIDDIDRLDRAETHLIFKLVKLSAGFQHTTYLLAFDDAVVAAALGERYGAGGETAGRAFLEKIVQVPLHLPAADTTALGKLVDEGLNAALNHAGIELTRSQVDVFALYWTSGLDQSLRTPRQALLYANALYFALPLVKGEVNIAEFMLIEGLRLFYPKLHQALRENATLILRHREGDREAHAQEFAALLKDATPDITPALRDRLASGVLAHLFPRITGMGYDPEWENEWARDQRVCSSSYFPKFFAYGVSSTEVSDRVVDGFIDALANQAQPEQDSALREIAVPEAAASFVRGLRNREGRVAAAVAPKLAHVVARNGLLFPLERGPMVMGGTRSQAAILVMHLVKQVPDSAARYALAAELLCQADPLSFASELLRWFSPSRNTPENEWVFDQGSFDRLRQLLVEERIVPADTRSPLYRQFGADSEYLYWWWHEVDAAGVSARLLTQLDDDPEEIDAFLDVHVGESWEIATGMPHRSDLGRHAYDNIALLVNPAEIARLLRARYGAELDEPQFHHGNDVPLARRFAHQFMFVHRAAEAEPSTAPGNQGSE